MDSIDNSPGIGSPSVKPDPIPGRRWTICAMLFAATTVNYIDRQALGLLKPIIESEFNWTETDYANIVFWFQVAYTLGTLLSGRIIDVFGPRIAFAGSIALYSVAAIAHAFMSTVAGFAVVRFLLGLGEASNMPASVRATAEWFPTRERAFAMGIFNAGTNVGSMIAPLLVPVLMIAFGWRGALAAVGVLAVILLGVWLWRYQSPEKDTKLSPVELAHIREGAVHDETAKAPPLRSILRSRRLWAVALTRFCTDPVWPFLLFWLPDFFNKRHDLNISQFGPPLFVIFLMAGVGSIGGGWISSRLIQGGMDTARARKLTLLGCAICATPAMILSGIDSVPLAVLVVGMVAAAHQAWGVTLWAICSDLFPKNVLGTVIAITGTVAGIGALLMITVVGRLLEGSDGYATIFSAIGFAYLGGFIIFLLAMRQSETPK